MEQIMATSDIVRVTLIVMMTVICAPIVLAVAVFSVLSILIAL
jgi:hypothetical protein